MDDLGADHLSDVSVSRCNLTKAAVTASNVAGNMFTEAESDLSLRIKEKEDTSCAASPSGEGECSADTDGKEKADATPENVKKIDDVISNSKAAHHFNANEVCENENRVILPKTGCTETTETVNADDSPSKHCLAFTIDFGNDNAKAKEAAASAKYKSMVERFQNRHKRGASLSKLENATEDAAQTQANVVSSSTMPPSVPTNEVKEPVKLRVRDRSASRVRDANLRHSWSPRSSTADPQPYSKVSDLKPTAIPIKPRAKPTSKKEASPAPPTPRFTPRSTAMQMALEKIDFYCPQPPLEEFVHQMGMNGVDDNLSETGTYTLDGDNYTEEQKELMNIDHGLAENVKQRPADLPLPLPLPQLSTSTVTSTTNCGNYYHDATATNYKPKTSYLDKIKSRVKNITKHPEKPKHGDLGTFTSITTSGVLAKKSSLDTHPKLARKSSLSKSQIDSSEYVSSEAKLRAKTTTTYSGGYTDHQKAEYRLNVFTNQTDAQILNAIESPSSPTSTSDVAVLKTAQTKNDWIQEWARNARARSVASAVKQSPAKQSSMTRSYCEATNDDVSTSTDDSLLYRHKLVDRFRLGEFDYCSDPNVSQMRNTQRPPKSPTKIPSPLHTIGRTRTAIRTRGSLQNILQANEDDGETDFYLQTTANVISNLAHTLSRKNSLKSSSSMNSPKRNFYSADEYSPQHQTLPATSSSGKHTHKRNYSLEYGNGNLMSNSLNEHLTEFKFPRARQNSFDAQALTVSPARMRQQQQQNYYIDQTRELIKQSQTSSPLRRSSSFSVKPLSATTPGQRRHPPQTLYTPPAARHQYAQPSRSNLQKSASSNSFRKMYSDYDDAVEYYINDEDDLIDEYCSSEGERGEETPQTELSTSSEVPLSNTRYNKALLMRIERSKQKVTGNNNVKPAPGGVMACPNTPELPRRNVQSAPRASMRQSVPRDTSLNRMKGQIPNSLASAKKQILQTATSVEVPSSTTPGAAGATSKKVQPKYLDISKYKPVQGANFLRKNDAKSTLKPEIRRSPSSASVSLSRADPTRTSNRSTKSAVVGGMSSRNASVVRRDSSVSKQKETELAMWKRRATYDPMKAAAEDRKKKEEAKKSSQIKSPCESSSVARSQSFHYGVATMDKQPPLPPVNNRWTYASNDSSDEVDCDDGR